MRNCSPVCPSNVLRRTPLYYNSDSFVCLYLLLYGGQLIYFFSFHLFLQRILNTWCTMCRLCSELSQHVRCCSTNSHNFFPPPNWWDTFVLTSPTESNITKRERMISADEYVRSSQPQVVPLLAVSSASASLRNWGEATMQAAPNFPVSV